MVLVFSDISPKNPDYGYEEGTPIGRFYLNRCMHSLCNQITGRVLEFGWPTYAAKASCTYELIDINPSNPRAHIVGDICDTNLAERYKDRYDWIICTAVLHCAKDPFVAVDNMYRMLRSGGHLVLAQQAASRMDPSANESDFWRFTPWGLRRLVERYSSVEVQTFGNVYVLCAYLYGIPAEQIDADKLEYVDSNFPLITVVHAVKT
ncbi:MAG: methyltransferase domain-containing protein [Hyphomicrobiaceae bacterium]|nr:methyltransferase domain-containing protein [Hyphomicrobiaceae bacterium]